MEIIYVIESQGILKNCVNPDSKRASYSPLQFAN